MRVLFNLAAICAVVTSAFLLMLGYEYSFGNGHGLHPGVVGAGIAILALAVSAADEALD
jgi:hypothetical protein